jgi:hypothetical protein
LKLRLKTQSRFLPVWSLNFRQRSTPSAQLWHQTSESHKRVIEREAGAPAIGENDHFVVEGERTRISWTYPHVFLGRIRMSDENVRPFHLATVLRSTPYRLARTPCSPGSLLERLGLSSQSRAVDVPALGLVLVPLAFSWTGRETALVRQRTRALQRAHGSAEPVDGCRAIISYAS